MGKKTKLAMFDSTWNPVTGCRHGCQYCYARRIANRFEGWDTMDENNAPTEAWNFVGKTGLIEVYRPMTRKTKDGETQTAVYPFGFAPTLHTYRLDEPQKWKEPKDVFVCSMADLFAEYIPDKWIEQIFEACEKAPQHRYFFLTKNPKRYADMYNRKLLQEHKNFWFGSTITHAMDPYFSAFGINSFLSIEPIQEYLDVGLGSFGSVKWIIVGAETGNRVGKVKPERKWIENIVETANLTQAPVFMKESLQELMGKDFRQEKP